MMQDTAPQMLARYHELLRAMTPAQRLRQASDLTMDVRALAEAGLRRRFPNADPEEVRARLAVRLYGRQAALRLRFACPIPDDAV